jgi:hypothetical protein
VVLNKTLNGGQRDRLRQMELQRDGLFAGEIWKELQATDEQRKQFIAVIQDMRRKIEPLIKEAQSGGDPHEIRPKIMQVRNDHEGELEALLTNAQKRKWKEMLGKPVDLGD